jgi:ectoine hydroxylase-related dioxygenase (phytanoyl-CoA dioxygenase family)
MPGESGWKPHRDKISGSLFTDRSPKSLTVWIPITKAHPLNGCMYVLPADRDEEYALENSVKGVGAIPDMRALPASPGDVLIWTQHLYHWSGRAAAHHRLPPRMSVAFEYQRKDVRPFRRPLLNPDAVFTFEERLALIAKQIMQYRHMYASNPKLDALAEGIAKACSLPSNES